jgi:hypothetical protein
MARKTKTAKPSDQPADVTAARPPAGGGTPSFQLYKRLLKLLPVAAEPDGGGAFSHVWIERHGSRQQVTCTDGFVLVRAETVVDASLFNRSASELLPRPLADALTKVKCDRESPIDLTVFESCVSAMLPSGMTLESPDRVREVFPDTHGVTSLPADAVAIEINPFFLAAALKALCGAADRAEKMTLHVVPGTNRVHLTCHDDTVEAMAVVMALGVTLCDPGRKTAKTRDGELPLDGEDEANVEDGDDGEDGHRDTEDTEEN